MGEHSILPPSGAGTWVICPMWISMNQLYPQEDTQETLEGTAAHWVLERKLRGYNVNLDDKTPQNILVTEEMLEGADLVVDHINKLGLNLKHLYIEEKLDCSSIHSQCFGTPDISHFDHSRSVIDLIDYKFGHDFIDEYENYQCLIYTDGLLNKFSKILNMGVGELDQIVTVNITIIQPRCYGKGSAIRKWSFKAASIRDLFNKIKMSAVEALSPNPRAVPNTGCKNCSGRHSCEALQREAYSSAHLATISLPLELSLDAASLELKMLERALGLLKARVDGLSEHIISKLKAGERAPHHHLTTTPGRKIWMGTIEEVIALGELFNIDLSKLDTITPTQAIKLGMEEDIVNAYSERKLGSAKLEADNQKDIRKIFGE